MLGNHVFTFFHNANILSYFAKCNNKAVIANYNNNLYYIRTNYSFSTVKSYLHFLNL